MEYYAAVKKKQDHPLDANMEWFLNMLWSKKAKVHNSMCSMLPFI